MKKKCRIISFASVLMALLNASAGGTGNEQALLRDRYREQVELYDKLESAESSVDPNSEIPATRLKEFENRVKLLPKCEAAMLPKTTAGISLMWSAYRRVSTQPATSSEIFNCGPNKSVVPYNGEFVDSAVDLSFQGRGGIECSFMRRYSAHLDYDCGFGLGWDHDFNAFLVFDSESISDSRSCTGLWHGQELRFENRGGCWTPRNGLFYSLELNKDSVYLLSPSLVRIEFEPSCEKCKDKSRWRLSAVASRHDSWKANRISVKYLPQCDRINAVVDLRGERIEFSYNDTGHIQGIRSPRKTISYYYDPKGCLIKVAYPSILTSLTKVVEPIVEYEYGDVGGRWLMRRKMARGSTFSLELEYDKVGRVTKCGYVGKKQGQSQSWQISYGDKVTKLVSPKPAADIEYHFVGSPHPSLPSSLIAASQKAVWKYAYNADGLPVREIDPIGVCIERVYDEANTLSRMHGNLLSERKIGSRTVGEQIEWCEFGTRVRYESNIDLPVETLVYQVGTNGIETIVSREINTYAPVDYTLSQTRATGGAEDGGITKRYFYNRYGEVAIEWDGNDNVSLCEYGLDAEEDGTFAFKKGSVQASGRLVRKIADANDKQIAAATKELGVSRIKRNTISRIAPVALITRYAYDRHGNVCRSSCGHEEKYYIRNSAGQILAEYDNGSGMKLYSYLPDGRLSAVDAEYCPNDASSFQGTEGVLFKGRYVRSSLEYDELRQISAQVLTDEKIGGVIPRFVYSRYESGKVKKIVNPSGICREDVYGEDTGYCERQLLKGGAGDLVIGENRSWYPNGVVESYADQGGAVKTNRLDAFGRAFAVVDSNGVVMRETKDACGRVVSRITSSVGKVFSWMTSKYSQDTGLLVLNRTWKSDDGRSGQWIDTEQNIYDKGGRLIATKNDRSESWQHYLYDGLDRKIGTIGPCGDMTFSVFRGDAEVMDISLSTDAEGASGEYYLQGVFKVIDVAARELASMPVDASGSLVPGRRTDTEYNATGAVIKKSVAGLSAASYAYDSLGSLRHEETTPLSALHGEKVCVVDTEYRADGKVLSKTVDNEALGIFGSEDDARTEFVHAPQKSETAYDEYGRIAYVLNPDGLKVSYSYNERSFPRNMEWSHLAKPGEVLRSIDFSYTDRGLISTIGDGKSNRVLQQFAYDEVGRPIEFVDKTSGREISEQLKYDSFGTPVFSKISDSAREFPARMCDYDPISGVVKFDWTGRTEKGSAYWQREVLNMDAAGRLTSVYLDDDDEPILRCTYRGLSLRRREVPAASMIQRYEYTALGEISSQSFEDMNNGQEIGGLEYAYGEQGQPKYSSTKIRSGKKEFAFSQYAEFDSYLRLTAQNGESLVPSFEDWPKEWKRALGLCEERSLSGQSALRMCYDKVNNIWVTYQGDEISKALPNAFSVANFPRFASPGTLLSSRLNNLPDLYLRELSSNREVTKASFGRDEKLKADCREYDLLGNMTCFEGNYWNGIESFPVDWSLSYDQLGRMVEMVAKAKDDHKFVQKDGVAAKLEFAYDTNNRRHSKRVVDWSRNGNPVTNETYTVYDGNRQKLVFEYSGENITLSEEYLWGSGSRELIMAAMARGEKDASVSPERFYFHQDRGLNAVYVTKMDGAVRKTVSASSYLGFGENATCAEIEAIYSSWGSNNSTLAHNHKRDDTESACWTGSSGPQFLEVKLDEEQIVSSFTVWTAENFPKDFHVFVLPEGEASPTSKGVLDWRREHTAKYLVAKCSDGIVQNCIKRNDWHSPYRISLGERTGNRIVLVWDKYVGHRIEVKEIEVQRTPDNPSAIAFAGQWLDRETGLYYQINRYRIAGSDKFISPDPLGFAAGDNLYAYANANPLEWHDPDGRLPNLLVQAGVGALIGAGMNGCSYLLSCWCSGKEFSWTDFGIEVAVGAVSGAVAGLTMGLFNPWEAKAATTIGQAVYHGAVRGAVSGATSGFVGGALNPALHGMVDDGDCRTVVNDALVGGLKGALLEGAIGGVLGGASGGYAQWKMMRPEDGAVWRVVRPDETPSNGLVPKDPSATRTVASHVGAGSRPGYKSQYISTTKDYEIAAKWAAKNPGSRIVKVNTSKISNNVYDLTDPSVSDQCLTSRWQRNFAKGSQEVVIEGAVKAEAITEAKFFGFGF